MPLEPIRALAGFEKERGSVFLSRAALAPPETLQLKIFPELEMWEADLDRREGSTAQDLAGRGFIKLLKYLRTVVLQVRTLPLYSRGQWFIL
jgi:hypothetical protein